MDGLIIKEDLTFEWINDSRKGIEESRLTSSIGAKYGNHLSFFNLQVNTLHCGNGAIPRF
jgi:hypothetical protein